MWLSVTGQSVTSALLARPDSDEDIPDIIIPYADSESDKETENVENVPDYEKPNKTNLKIGSFLLVNILSGSREKSKYVYVAVFQSLNDNIFNFNGLKSIDNTKQTYKMQAKDLFEVDMDDIIAVLKMPTLTKTDNYIFSHPLTEVREL